MNKKIEQIVEFQKIRQELINFATTELGKQWLYELSPYKDEQKIQKLLAQTNDAVELLRLKQGIPVPKLKDIRMHLKRLAMEAVLNAHELADILKVLTTTKQVEQFFTMAKGEAISLEELYVVSEQLVTIPEIARVLAQSISEDGCVLDNASTALKGIRQGIHKAEQTIRERLTAYVTGKTASYLSDTVITMRNDRYVIPVKVEYKQVFGGIVHDQSSSGQTLFMEPQAIVELNNRLKELQSKERAEIERILTVLSQEVAVYVTELEQNNDVLAQFDVLNAKARYAHQLKATRPIISSQNYVQLWQARHPLIDRKKVVANDIVIGKEYQAIVITGPNTGGKTIMLKTLAMIQLMAQSGLFIPCGEESQVGVFTEIFADIGDEQSLEQNLSTFSSHMSSIVSILEQIDDKSLVLLDEIGSGTDPQEGASLAIAILDYIGSKSSYVMASTHYPELKAYAYQRVGTTNASMEFDSHTLQPTYRFLIGIPGRSNALDISKRLGLPEEIILQARSFVSVESQELNEMIADLEQKRREVEQEQQNMIADIQEANTLVEQLRHEYQDFVKNKEQLLEQAKEKANELVEESQRQAEKIMADIRELQLRGQHAVVKEHELIEKRGQLQELKHERALKKNKVLNREKAKKALKVGQSVQVDSFGQKGVLIEKISDKEWVVQMGIIKMKLPVEDLIPQEEREKQQKTQVIFRSASANRVTSELDLRGERYENALKELDRYLDAAILAGYGQVTIIHGRGTGALQQGVHKALRTHRSVKAFEFAPINMGGNGATIVQFK